MASFNSRRTLSFDLASEALQIKGFRSTRWRIADLSPGDAGPWVLDLQLFLTERAAYRFNLTGGIPRLFVRCGQSGDIPKPSAITASQDVAAAWLDGEHEVLEVDMPLAIQAWLEGYLVRHGEAPEEGRKKKRKGAGRARAEPMSRLERWSRRKLGEDTEAADASDIDAVIDNTRDAESGEDLDAAHHDGDADNAEDGAGEPPAPGSLDATLPDPESLAPGSDIKAFLEPGVSSGLRRRALRRLFAGEKYGIRDGLDDYDHDYREKLKPLASELAQRMRKWTAPAEETPEEGVPADEDSSGEAASSPVQSERPVEQDEEPSSEEPASEDSPATDESLQLDDGPMLDQGRGGSRRQFGQD